MCAGASAGAAVSNRLERMICVFLALGLGDALEFIVFLFFWLVVRAVSAIVFI
jgi:hypothetical protein